MNLNHSLIQKYDGKDYTNSSNVYFVGGTFKTLQLDIRVTLNIKRIKNPIKQNGVKHILRHIYYATMQKFCKFEALYRPEI